MRMRNSLGNKFYAGNGANYAGYQNFGQSHNGNAAMNPPSYAPSTMPGYYVPRQPPPLQAHQYQMPNFVVPELMSSYAPSQQVFSIVPGQQQHAQYYITTTPFVPVQQTQFASPSYSNTGQAFVQLPPNGFTGPPATELQAPPTLMSYPPPQPLPPPPQLPPMQPQSSQVPMANYHSGGANVVVSNAPSTQRVQQPVQRRERKMLEIVDPHTNQKIVMENERKANEQHAIASDPQPPTRLWRPPPDQQQLVAPSHHGNSQHGPPETTSSVIEPKPSGSRSNSPRFDQPNAHESSGQSIFRAASPVPENSQKIDDDKRLQFFTDFVKQLSPGDLPSNDSSELPQQNLDSDLMPPPAAVPPIRTSSRNSSRHSSGRTPPPTPPPVPLPIHSHATKFSGKMLEIGLDPSFIDLSKGATSKPTDVVVQQRVEFGWTDESSSDMSDCKIGGRAPSPREISEDTYSGRQSHCSTPQRMPPPLDLPRSRSPLLVMEPGFKGDIVQSSSRGRDQSKRASPTEQLLNGNQLADNDGYFGVKSSSVNSFSNASSFVYENNSDATGQDSLEDGEIRDSVSEQSRSSKSPAPTTEEDKNSILILLEQLKSLAEPSGRRGYSHEFMKAAANLPSSKMKPNFQTSTWSQENIDEVFDLKRQAKAESSKSRTLPYNAVGAGAGFNVPWMMQTVDTMPGRRPYPGRSSAEFSAAPVDRMMKGPRPGPGGSGRQAQAVYPRQQPMVIARASVEVELKSAGEKAWKPSHKTDVTEDNEQTETKKLYKEVRSILNKITPQTFDELSDDFMALEPRMNTVERASGVVDIVFQKAVDEPSFGEIYSKLVERVVKHQRSKKQQSKEIDFNPILLTKCQAEFERDKKTERTRNEREEAISKAEEVDVKKQLQDELDEFLMKEKRQTLGNIRFIGTLYHRNMLTGKIMHFCVMNLLKNTGDEESVECLCKLLTTMGNKLEAEQNLFHEQIDGYYSHLQEISGSLSSRVRFMILDLLELRGNSWQSRRKGEGPKTIEQLHEDAAKEKWEQQQELLQKEEQRKRQDYAAQQESRKGGGSRDASSRQNHGPYEHDGRKGERGAAGRDKEQHRQSERHGASNSQRPTASADLSKAKAPALSQHLGADSEVRLGPSTRGGWNKQKPTSSTVQTRRVGAEREAEVAERNE